MFPTKLQKGESYVVLLERYNQLVDYLRETRLVAGPGVSISRLPSGTVVNAPRQPAAAVPTPPEGHPFDAQLVNKGTVENPDYYVRIYNSALPDSPYAGVVGIYEWDIPIPVTELKVPSGDGAFVVVDVTYVKDDDPPYAVDLKIFPYGSGGEVGYTTARTYIAEVKIPNVTSRMDSDIYISGRWV